MVLAENKHFAPLTDFHVVLKAFHELLEVFFAAFFRLRVRVELGVWALY